MKQDPMDNSSAAGVDPINEARSSLVRFAPGAGARSQLLPLPEKQGSASNRAAALLMALQRLENVVDEEVSALRQREVVDFDQFSRRKNRGLLELVRSNKAAGDANSDPEIVAQVARLRTKLEQNQKMLRLHFEAVRSVSEIIRRAIREADSDGTYPAMAARKQE